MPNLENKLADLFGDKLKKSYPLKGMTTFKIGGEAKYYLQLESEKEVAQALEAAKKYKASYFILGGGSNILVADKGYDGLVIKYIGDKIKAYDDFIEASAGASLAKVIGKSVGAGLSGLEWASGIPGTLGGAIYGNAGAYGSSISDSLVSIKYFKAGKIKEMKAENAGFSYRRSIFKESTEPLFIISALLKLKKADPTEMKNKIKEIIAVRNKKFRDLACAGSIFKNVELDSGLADELKNKSIELPEAFNSSRVIPAAWLIESCDLKGKTIGGAVIDENNANLIFNDGTAKAEDVIILISLIKQKVRSRFNIQLVEEIAYLGF